MSKKIILFFAVLLIISFASLFRFKTLDETPVRDIVQEEIAPVATTGDEIINPLDINLSDLPNLETAEVGDLSDVNVSEINIDLENVISSTTSESIKIEAPTVPADFGRDVNIY